MKRAIMDRIKADHEIDKTALHTQGYSVLRGVIPIKPGLIEALQTVPIAKYDCILNHNDHGCPDDELRWQFPFAENTNQYTMQFHRQIMALFRNQLPDHRPHYPCVLVSGENCQRQFAHCDYEINADLAQCPDQFMPLNCIVALAPDTKIYVWPESIRFPWINLEFLEVEMEQRIDPVCVTLSPGDMIIFRGDLTHAGAAYPCGNMQVHYYLNTTRISYVKNQIWFSNNKQMHKVINYK